MSVHQDRIVKPDDWGVLQQMKAAGRKIVSLTAYTRWQSRLIAPHVDFMLVGDSVAMVWYKRKTTQDATLDMMIRRAKKVVKARGKTPVVVDMPECCYAFSDDASDAIKTAKRQEALEAAQRIMKETGCQAVKLEGGVEMAETVRLLVENGIPVMGHIGLLPSKFGANDPYKIAGKGQEAAQKLVDDAVAIQKAGAFAIVIEGSVEPVASFICKKVLTIPTIGIGATPDADGQILVNADAWKQVKAGEKRKIKFAPSFRLNGRSLLSAVKLYAASIRNGIFPHRVDHCYNPQKFKVDVSKLTVGS